MFYVACRKFITDIYDLSGVSVTRDGLVTSANWTLMNAKETTRAKTEVPVQTCKVITPVTAVTLGTEADSVKNS